MNETNGRRSPKLNVLYVAASLPFPPDKGERIRVFHQLRELAREHQVHLVCFSDRDAAPSAVEALEAIGVTVQTAPITRFGTWARAVSAFARGLPREPHALGSVPLRRTIEGALRKARFDVILASTVGVTESVRDMGSLPKALDLMDVTSELWSESAERSAFPWSWFHGLEARRLATYEAEVVRSFDSTIVVSEEEARIFRQRVADLPVTVVGNGVDLDAFVPVPESAGSAESSRSVVFTGSMDYFPNVDAVLYFCGAILPHVRAAVPDVHFQVVGRNPTRAILDLQREGHINVSGYVPDVRPYLAQAAVAVAPFRISRGVPNKILEAMASGLPVVGSSRVLDVLEVGGDDGARRADDPESFAREVVALIEDAEWRARCSLSARRFVERCHGWEMHSPSGVLESIVERD